MLCYSAGPCRGDLGGGLVCNGRLVGVFNGVEDTLCNLPGYYTDVQVLIDSLVRISLTRKSSSFFLSKCQTVPKFVALAYCSVYYRECRI